MNLMNTFKNIIKTTKISLQSNSTLATKISLQSNSTLASATILRQCCQTTSPQNLQVDLGLWCRWSLVGAKLCRWAAWTARCRWQSKFSIRNRIDQPKNNAKAVELQSNSTADKSKHNSSHLCQNSNSNVGDNGLGRYHWCSTTTATAAGRKRRKRGTNSSNRVLKKIDCVH